MTEKNLRLDKYLADMKVGTRSEVKTYIRKCRVTVNGEVVRETGHKILPTDSVAFDGRKIGYVKKEYIMLNKPAGVLTAARDKKAPTVFSLLSDTKRKDLFPVGRLDKDTEGLLLITNDGELAHCLLSPKKHVDKLYYAKVRGQVDASHVAKFAAGLLVDGEFTALPAKLAILRAGEVSEVELTIQEGKFHQVKRMFEAVGMEVIFLKRLAVGNLRLDGDLPVGAFRSLTDEEVSGLMCLCGDGPDQGRNPWAKKEDPLTGEDSGQTDEADGFMGRNPILENKEASVVEKDSSIALTKMLYGIRGVLFDLDGTLVDSMWMWEQIDIEYLGRFGIPLPQGLQGQIEGMSFSETAQYFKQRFPAITETIEEMKVTWNRMAWEKYAHEVFLKPGALGFLKYLKGKGIRTGIATSNSAELVHTVLSSLNAEEYFDEVHTACEVKAGKPAPDLYLYVAKTLGLLPQQCLVFEDICKGIAAGKAAGMRVCAVDDAYSKEAEWEKRKMADYFIKDYTDFGF